MQMTAREHQILPSTNLEIVMRRTTRDGRKLSLVSDPTLPEGDRWTVVLVNGQSAPTSFVWMWPAQALAVFRAA